MGRRKKEENVVENPTPMAEDAMNLPVEEEVEAEVEVVEESGVEEEEGKVPEVEPVVEAEKEPEKEPEKEAEPIIAPSFKVISSHTALVNLRTEPEGEVIRTIKNGSKVLALEEKDGWTKVYGYIKSELLKPL